MNRIRAIDDPVKLAWAARIIRTALERKRTTESTDHDLRLCSNCGTELGRLETGQRCNDCKGPRR